MTKAPPEVALPRECNSVGSDCEPTEQKERELNLRKRIDDLELTILAQKAEIIQAHEARLRLERLSTRDELTGLHNRRHLDERLVVEVSRSRRYHHRFCLLILDVDGFKAINTRFGRQVGDDLLRGIATALRASSSGTSGVVRVSDEFVRYGDDEFIVLATETDLWGGQRLAERIVERIRRVTIQAPTGVHIEVSTSIGVASFPGHGKEPALLIDAADRALQTAKRVGGVYRCADDLPRAGSALVVGGDNDWRACFRDAMERNGYAIASADSEADAFDEILSGDFVPDVIVVKLPDEADWDVLRRLCVNAKLAKIHIILLTKRPSAISELERARLRNPVVAPNYIDLSELVAVIGQLRQGREPGRHDSPQDPLRMPED